ncbi:hypothetical protein [Candidatus Odyssella acanthamoebae]|uniref:Uncharacterized protein n=1 Tax=Candidatus Odyssella acanthamoebae TaxID=91604 RepID=A0A077AVX2_9PROT|nr:hypothetical protein [Candidatus Paracaedibacter acanthamoebae]AIK95808.1 hypothetical protein ID47_02240 [Candidatus Paracaedibacter acanthamoebae]
MNKLQLLSAFTLSTIFVSASDDLLFDGWVKVDREEAATTGLELNLQHLIPQRLIEEASLIELAFQQEYLPVREKRSLSEAYQEDYFMQEKVTLAEQLEASLIPQMHDNPWERTDGNRLRSESQQADGHSLKEAQIILGQSLMWSPLALQSTSEGSKVEQQASLGQSDQQREDLEPLVAQPPRSIEPQPQVVQQPPLQSTKKSRRMVTQQSSSPVAQQSHVAAKQIQSPQISSSQGTAEPTTPGDTLSLGIAQQPRPQVTPQSPAGQPVQAQVTQQPRVATQQRRSPVEQQPRVATQQRRSPVEQQPRVATQQRRSPVEQQPRVAPQQTQPQVQVTAQQPRPQVTPQPHTGQQSQQSDPLQVLRRLQQLLQLQQQTQSQATSQPGTGQPAQSQVTQQPRVATPKPQPQTQQFRVAAVQQPQPQVTPQPHTGQQSQQSDLLQVLRRLQLQLQLRAASATSLDSQQLSSVKVPQ